MIKPLIEYEKAIAILPAFEDPHYNLGLSYYRRGMYDRAAAEYEKAIGINPQFAKAYNDLGFVYYTKGMYDKATAACERALSINPGLAQAHNYLGLIYHTEGMYDAAIAAYEKALSINPALAESHHNLGLHAAWTCRLAWRLSATIRLVESGVVQVVAVTNPPAAGYRVMTLIDQGRRWQATRSRQSDQGL